MLQFRQTTGKEPQSLRYAKGSITRSHRPRTAIRSSLPYSPLKALSISDHNSLTLGFAEKAQIACSDQTRGCAHAWASLPPGGVRVRARMRGGEQQSLSPMTSTACSSDNPASALESRRPAPLTSSSNCSAQTLLPSSQSRCRRFWCRKAVSHARRTNSVLGLSAFCVLPASEPLSGCSPLLQDDSCREVNADFRYPALARVGACSIFSGQAGSTVVEGGNTMVRIRQNMFTLSKHPPPRARSQVGRRSYGRKLVTA
jgi:hypothetical protein